MRVNLCAAELESEGDGFLSAYYLLPAASRPELRLYDTGALPGPEAIAQARAAGFRLLNELEASRDPRGHFLLPDSRADLLRRPGDWTAAP